MGDTRVDPADVQTDTDDAAGTDDTNTADAADTGGGDLAAEVAKWKKYARQHEAAAKKNTDAAARLAELEDKDKTELERLSGRAAAAEAKAAEAEAKVLRLEIAADKGLTPTQARRLIGTTREELEADADELLDAFGGSQSDGAGAAEDDAPARQRRRPAEKLRPGAAPAGVADKVDPAALAKKILSSPY